MDMFGALLAKSLSKGGGGGGDSSPVVIFNISEYKSNGYAVISDGKTAQDIANTISGGKIPILVGSDGKIYFYLGSESANPETSQYTFCYFKWVWNSTDNKSNLELYMVAGISNNKFKFCAKQTLR